MINIDENKILKNEDDCIYYHENPTWEWYEFVWITVEEWISISSPLNPNLGKHFNFFHCQIFTLQNFIIKWILKDHHKACNKIKMFTRSLNQVMHKNPMLKLKADLSMK